MRDRDVEVLCILQNGGGSLEDSIWVGRAEGGIGKTVLGFFEEFADVFFGLHTWHIVISIAVHLRYRACALIILTFAPETWEELSELKILLPPVDELAALLMRTASNFSFRDVHSSRSTCCWRLRCGSVRAATGCGGVVVDCAPPILTHTVRR